MKSTFSVIYYLKRQVVKKDGTVPVMGRITVDGSQTQFSCKLTVDPKLWDTKGGRVTGRSTAALETNRMLDKMRVRINRHYQEIMERDNFVTAEKVKNAFLGLEHRYHTLMQVFRRHNEDYEKQVEAGMKAKGTLEKYRIVYKHLQEFLDIRYHVKDIALKELTPAFISDFEMFLRTDKHCCTNTVWLYVCPLRTMVFIAINNEWLTRDPFREYEIKKEETTRSFLTKEEIRLLMEGKLKNAKQELYRDLYLFCAFTGLSFSDMRNLTEENIRTYFDEHEWININRQKTGVVSNIRLLDIANRIIGKYRGLCENGRIFPVPHYNTCLAGIRAVAKRCGITKHITWHQSRAPVRARYPSLPPPSGYRGKGAHGIRPSSENGTACSEPSQCQPPASSHRQPKRSPCATGFPISDFYVQPDAARISVPVPYGCGRCGGRGNPG